MQIEQSSTCCCSAVSTRRGPGSRRELGLRRLFHEGGAKVFGTFLLPLQKKREGPEMTLDEESQQRHGFGKREIVAVGKSLDELEKALPATWKSLWVPASR